MHYGDGFASKNDEKTLVPTKSGVRQELRCNLIAIVDKHRYVFLGICKLKVSRNLLEILTIQNKFWTLSSVKLEFSGSKFC